MWSIQNDVLPISDLVPKFEHKKIVQTFFKNIRSVPAGVYQLPAKTSKCQLDPGPALCFEAHLTSAASAGPGGVKTMQSAEATKLCLNIQAFF